MMLAVALAGCIRSWLPTWNQGWCAVLIHREAYNHDLSSEECFKLPLDGDLQGDSNITDSTVDAKQNSSPATPAQHDSSPLSAGQEPWMRLLSRHFLVTLPAKHVESRFSPWNTSWTTRQYHSRPTKVFSPGRLTRDIKEKNSPAELLQLVERYSDWLDRIHIATAFTQLGQWQRAKQLAADEHDVLNQLLNELERLLLSTGLLQQCQPRELCNIFYSCSILRYTSTPLYSRCLQEFVSKLPSVEKLQDVSNVLYGLAVAGQHITQDEVDRMLAVAVKQEMLDTAVPQGISNIIWSAATLSLVISQHQLQQLMACLISKLAECNPQSIANTLWGIATMGQQLPAQQLHQLLNSFMQKLRAANPLEVSMTLWAVATMGQQLPIQQLQQYLDFLISMSADLDPQVISNTLLAMAKMNAVVCLEQLQHLERLFVSQVTKAKAQAICNVLWSCGELQCHPQELLTALQAQQLWQRLLPVMEPRQLSQVAVALGALGHRDEQLMAAVLQQAVDCIQHQHEHAVGHLTAYRSGNDSPLQAICNLCWSAALLDLQHHIPEVMTLVHFYGNHVEHDVAAALRQLQQVHLWLLDVQKSDVTGLGGVLTADQLRRCKDAWIDQLHQNAAKSYSKSQKEVFKTLQQLPLTWRTPPAMEQLCEPDGMFSIDISGVTADGVRLAIEADGPTHFRRPDNKPTGPTLYRNRALAARGYVVVSVPFYEWDKRKSPQQKQQYLMVLLQQQSLFQGKRKPKSL